MRRRRRQRPSYEPSFSSALTQAVLYRETGVIFNVSRGHCMSNRCWVLGALLFVQIAAGAETPLAFPGAVGVAATTAGGRGGEIAKVTSLAASGPGSLLEAVRKGGPRTGVFEVGGVIDLAESTVKITEPFLTIAGQTAPAPGITLIRGGIDIATHDV